MRRRPAVKSLPLLPNLAAACLDRVANRDVVREMQVERALIWSGHATFAQLNLFWFGAMLGFLLLAVPGFIGAVCLSTIADRIGTPGRHVQLVADVLFTLPLVGAAYSGAVKVSTFDGAACYTPSSWRWIHDVIIMGLGLVGAWLLF